MGSMPAFADAGTATRAEEKIATARDPPRTLSRREIFMYLANHAKRNCADPLVEETPKTCRESAEREFASLIR